ncbi:c-type cytochrome [Crenalkalicoccus roseus]|uniref:c-type cytochrome n=1 Tax=Crenalkalicoccus roseus TaxID=1485588 RepID=UPI0013050FD6|nr:c-type cytochrome [Crenalkalicoccus roseus]
MERITAALGMVGLLVLGVAAPAAATGPAPLAAQGCLGCHGPGGAGMASVPPLAGRDAQQIEAMLRGFRDDALPGTIMNRIARGYTDAEIAALAAYFAATR